VNEPPGTGDVVRTTHVLYVDDDTSFLEIVKVILEKDGEFSVTVSTEGDEALHILERGEFDIVLSDCRMVRMDGATFRGRVRLMFPSMPFIFLTGREKKEGISGMLDDKTWYLQKGGDPAVQFARLADLIRICTRSQGQGY
jgi:CheY-like chemotaxis protein